MSSNLPRLGIDCGSAAVKLVVMDVEGRVLARDYAYHKGDPAARIAAFLESAPWREFALVAATAGTPLSVHADHRSEAKICFIEAVKRARPEVRNILLVGAEKFARVLFDDQGYYRKMRANSACAAGTGSFLDQQALRLGIASAAELADLASRAGPETPRIASRCSVFAKTDLIHAQQEGWTLAEISEGLCAGLSRNIADTLFPGESLEGPVVMAGGVALNRRVVAQLSRLAGCPIEADELAPFYGAVGAVLRTERELRAEQAGDGTAAAPGAPLPVRPPRRREDILVPARSERAYAHAPLGEPKGSYPDFRSYSSSLHAGPVLGQGNPVEVDLYRSLAEGAAVEGGAASAAGRRPRLRARLGVDIGSTSTKAALLAEEGAVLAGLYARTAGDPVRAAQGLLECLRALEAEAGVELEILSCATTGSGRKLVGAVLGADGVVDEITAHARAAVELDPRVDTIIEIGGQDSKFTVVKDGVVVFSHMNTVCAAGTGSFIEEQAAKLGVPIRDYAERASGRPSPATSDRCTVFMERDLNNFQNEGYAVEELLAATLFSVADNYLSKVAMEGAIGTRVVFQGATAKNRALVTAFERRLCKPVAVSPYCHITGAIGAALQARDDAAAKAGPDPAAAEVAPAVGGTSAFKGLDLWKERVEQRAEVCEGCGNACKLHVLSVQGEEIVYGYLCGRGAGDRTFVSKNRSGFDLLRERNALLERVVRRLAPGTERGGRSAGPDGEAATGGRDPAAAGPLDGAAAALSELPGRFSRAVMELSAQAIDAITDAAYQAVESAMRGAPDGSQGAAAPAPPPQAPLVGIPRCLYLQEDARLWAAFFEELGFRTRLGEDSADSMAAGKRIAGADFCAPLSMIHGQTQALLETCDYVFLPIYLEAPPRRGLQAKPDGERRFFCNYAQFAPTLVDVATASGGRVLKPLVYSSLGSDAEAARELRESLVPVLEARGLPAPLPSAVERAYARMRRMKAAYDESLKELYARVRPEEGELAIMLTGRPYTALSRGLNKGIPDLFAQAGLKVLFHDMFEAPETRRQDRELQAYHWYYASKVIETALYCRDRPGLYPVLVTSFKCGPDSFAIETFKSVLDRASKPYLVLQVDEHESAVGYETRVEAAVRAFRNHFAAAGRASEAAGPAPAGHAAEPERFPISPNARRPAFPRAKTVLLPNWDPYVCELLAAGLRGRGVDARVLEEDQEHIRRAMTLNSGQCIPVSAVAHETVKYLERHGLDPERTALWMVRALWPCNIPLYPLQMESVFRKSGGGLERLEVYAGDLTFIDFSPRMTLDAYYAYALGGLLRKAACRTRPFEALPGLVDALVARTLRGFAEALERRKPLLPEIRGLAAELEALPRREGRRPLVAIFGDFYVRDNEVFNQDLVRGIERAGGEVVVTSYVEYLKATSEAFFERLLHERRYGDWLGYRAVLAAVAAVERSLARRAGIAMSDGTWTNPRRREAFGRFGLRPEMSGENFDNALKILKILDEYPDLALFVQAAPAFCCPSLVTEAMSGAIEEVTGVPVLTVTYDGTGAYKNDLVEPYLARYGEAR